MICFDTTACCAVDVNYHCKNMFNCSLYLLAHLYTTQDDEEGDEEEELYGKRLTGRDKSGKSKSGSGIGGAFDDEDNDDGNLARIKERTRGPKTSSRGGAGEGEEGGRVKAPKQLSVQAQMVCCDHVALDFMFICAKIDSI